VRRLRVGRQDVLGVVAGDRRPDGLAGGQVEGDEMPVGGGGEEDRLAGSGSGD
jgi:hypothetical protein